MFGDRSAFAVANLTAGPVEQLQVIAESNIQKAFVGGSTICRLLPNVNGGEKSWRLAGEKCSALPEEITRWSVAGSSRRGVCSLLRPCTGPA